MNVSESENEIIVKFDESDNQETKRYLKEFIWQFYTSNKLSNNDKIIEILDPAFFCLVCKPKTRLLYDRSETFFHTPDKANYASEIKLFHCPKCYRQFKTKIGDYNNK